MTGEQFTTDVEGAAYYAFENRPAQTEAPHDTRTCLCHEAVREYARRHWDAIRERSA